MSPSRFQFFSARVFLASRARPAVGAAFFGALLLFSSVLPTRSFAAGNSLEYQVKAGFLFNFAKFVEWPAGAQASSKSLRLGIIAPDEIYDLMEKSLSGKMVGDRPVHVERVTAAEIQNGAELPSIVFIHQDILRLRQDLGFTQQQLFSIAEKQPVLIVGESAGFATSGGMIGFVQRGENLRFQVNLANAQHAGLKLSARLSGLAEIVNSTP